MGFEDFESHPWLTPVIDRSGSQVLHAGGLWGLCLRNAGDVALRFLSHNSLGQFSVGSDSASNSTKFSVGTYLLRGERCIVTHLGTLYENRLLAVCLFSGADSQG